MNADVKLRGVGRRRARVPLRARRSLVLASKPSDLAALSRSSPPLARSASSSASRLGQLHGLVAAVVGEHLVVDLGQGAGMGRLHVLHGEHHVALIGADRRAVVARAQAEDRVGDFRRIADFGNRLRRLRAAASRRRSC